MRVGGWCLSHSLKILRKMCVRNPGTRHMSFKIYDRFTNFCAQFRNLGIQVPFKCSKDSSFRRARISCQNFKRITSFEKVGISTFLKMFSVSSKFRKISCFPRSSRSLSCFLIPSRSLGLFVYHLEAWVFFSYLPMRNIRAWKSEQTPNVKPTFLKSQKSKSRKCV